MEVERVATDRYRVRAHNQIITLSSQDLLELMAYGQLHASELEQGGSITARLDAIETALQLLAGNITNMRTELLVIKGLLAQSGKEEV